MKQFFVSEYRRAGMSDSDVIEACLSAAMAEEEREVVFDEPFYLISRSVLIPSRTTVVLDGCTVKQQDLTFDTAFRGDNLGIDPENPNGFPLSVRPIEGIRLLGKNGATVSGPDRNGHDLHAPMAQIQELVGDFWGWRTLTVSFTQCDGLEISGIHFVQTRCWCISLDLCRNGYLHDLRIDSNIKNGDGIDLRSGCRHFLLERISGVTSDDNIACTALFENGSDHPYPVKNYVYPLEPGGKTRERPAIDRDISDVTIRDCRIGGMHHGVVCLAANGCRIYDVRIENIEECEAGPWKDPYNEAAVKLYTGYGSGYTPGDLHDITVSNVVSRFADYPVFSNAEVKNVTLKNVVSENGGAIRLEHPEGFTVIG